MVIFSFYDLLIAYSLAKVFRMEQNWTDMQPKTCVLTMLNKALWWRICGCYQNLLHIAIFLAIRYEVSAANIWLENRF